MVKTYTVLVDDNLLSYSSAGTSAWTTGKGNSDLFLNSSTHDAARSQLSFAYSFFGKSLSWTGVLWQTEDIEFSISIDGGNPSTCSSQGGDEDLNVYKELCSTAFGNGQHTVNVTCQEQDAESPVSIDYATFTVDSDDDVPPGLSPGMFLLTDDQDGGITYSGTWATDGLNRYRSPADKITRLPYGSGAHRSSAVGAKMSYMFSGTSVTVYGVEMFASGALAATLDIDGARHANLSITGTGDDGAMSNKALISASGLSHDQHEMVLTVTGVSGDQSLVVDYILYEPLFEKSSHTGTASATSTSVLPTTTSSSSAGSSSKSKAWIGGVVFALLAVLALFAGLAFWWWKRKRRQDGNFEIEGWTPKEPCEYKAVSVSEPANPPAALISLDPTGPSLLARTGSEPGAHPFTDTTSRRFDLRDGQESVLENPWDRLPPDYDLQIASRGNQASGPDVFTRNMATGSEPLPAISALIVAADTPPPVPTKGKERDGSLPFPPDNVVAQSQTALLEKSRRNSATLPTNVVPSQATKLEQLDTKRRSVSGAPVDGEYSRNSFERDAVQSQATKLQAIESHKRAVSMSPPHPSSRGSGSLELNSGITTRNSTTIGRSSADIVSPISPSEQSGEQVEELRIRNEMLVREIARLSELQAPPAYEPSGHS